MTRAAQGAEAPGPARQLVALLRMELRALRRNRTAAVMSVGAPLAIGIVLAGEYEGGPPAGIARMGSMLALVAVLAVHHHLITVYASRRQELVLKRLRAGLLSDDTILAGAAAATLTIYLLQGACLVGYGVVVLGLPVPGNPLLILVALGLAAAVMAMSAAALSAITRSAEAAMLTSLPTVVLFLAAPGAMVPLGTFSEPIEEIARYSPMGAFTAVVREAWLGTTGLDTFLALGALAVWTLLGWALARAVFRWEPRA